MTADSGPAASANSARGQLAIAPDGFWTADSLRSKVKGMVEGQYGIAMARIMSHPDFSKLMDIETAAQTRYDGLMYIEAVQKICSEYTRRGLPEPTPYKPPVSRRLGTTIDEVETLSELSKRAQSHIARLGLGSERYGITGQCEANWHGNQAAYFVELAFALHERRDKGWREAIITRIDVDNAGWSWRLSDNSQFIHTQRINDPSTEKLMTVLPELRKVMPNHSLDCRLKVKYKNQSNGLRNTLTPAVYALEKIEEPMPKDKTLSKDDANLLDELTKSGAALTDELTGKLMDEKPVEAPKPQPLKFEDAKPERPPFPTEVANLISEAFPLASSEYKAQIFKTATGHATIAKAKEAEMSEWAILDMLRNEIASIKSVEANLPPADDERPAALMGLPELPPDPPAAKSEPQTALATIEAPTVPNALVPFNGYATPQIPRSLQIMSTEAGARLIDLAKSVASSKMYPGVDSVDKAIVIMWKGVELGIEPFAALEGIHIIMGKPSLSANLMLSLANSSGLIRDIRIVATNEWCEVTMWRKDRSQPHVERFTTEDARTAGLYAKNQSLWPKFPKAMCKARAISNCFKAVCPELAMGIRGLADDDEQDEDKMLARELVAA